ncbi:MAG TPA: chromosome segregation protein SMC [Petrotogaceae bacterium]|mgnify:FL=1|nr:chromosome segregation protein SMC [Petrotogaceae bacterium]HQC40565.1 chromosome segregation protein SMC [Petrotogaceae bacterium]
MKLISLEINGFKSFANNTALDLSKNIIAIVGPNGSGKSNIVDAIRWLLGEQSSRQIRISEKTDVIFNGTDEQKPSSKASVFLSMTDSQDKKISVGRVLERNGSSVYYINNKPSLLKDIYRVFENRGVGKQFYSIISQGQVSEIVNSSPEAIMKIVLDAAEIGEYIEKKNSSLLLLSKTSENLERLNDVLFEMDKRIKSLSNRASRAQKYLKYKQELNLYAKEFLGSKKIQLIEQKEMTATEIKDMELKLNSFLSQLFETERKYRALKEEIESTDKELSKHGELIEAYRTRLSSLEEQKNTLNQKKYEINSNIMNLTMKIEVLDEQIKNNSEKAEVLSAQEKAVEAELEVLVSELAVLQAHADETEKKLQDDERHLNEVISKHEELKATINADEQSMNSSSVRLSSLQERMTILSHEKESTIALIEKMEEYLHEIENTVHKDNKEELAARNAISEKESETDKISAELSNTNRTLYELMKDSENVKYKIELIKNQISDYDGYMPAVKSFIKNFRNDDNVIDVAANLFEIDQAFEQAVSSSVGHKLQNVVIKSSSKSQEYVDYIKKIGEGKITFLPLDLINAKVSYKRSVTNEPGVLGYMIDLCRYDQKYKKIMEYLFLNTLVVDDIKTAIKISKTDFSSSIVTLGGEVLSGYGSITAGKIKNDYSSTILKRKRELEQLLLKEQELSMNIEHYTQLQKTTTEAFSKAENEKKQLREKLTKIIMEKEINNSNYKKTLNDYDQKKEYLKLTMQSIDSIRKESSDLNEQICSLSIKLADMKDELSKTISILESESLQCGQKKEEIRSISSVIYQKKLENSSLDKRYSDLKSASAFIYKEKEEALDKKFDLQESISTLSKEKQKTEDQYKDILQNYDTLNNEISKLLEISKQSRLGKSGKAMELDCIEKERNQKKEELSLLREEKQKKEFDVKSLEMQLDILSQKAYSFDIKDEELVLSKKSDSDIQALENKINDIEKAVKNLGSVDTSVLQEFDEASRDYDEKSVEKKDIVTSISMLKESIQQIDALAQDKFDSFFLSLNNQFSAFIQKLFINGYGELKLIGEGKSFEKNIEISVRKSGRNFQKLSLFSGGEKALIAIAFLFSLMNLNPSPFYILDEVDAPLDDINAAKLSELIRENAAKSQFLVITHNKILMESAELFHGITMKKGITRVIPVDFKEFA